MTLKPKLRKEKVSKDGEDKSNVSLSRERLAGEKAEEKKKKKKRKKGR